MEEARGGVLRDNHRPLKVISLLAAVLISALWTSWAWAGADRAGPCALKECWGDLFEEVRIAASASFEIAEQALVEYESAAQRFIRLDPDSARKPFYELANYRACLRECESLIDLTRNGGSIDLLVIGRHFDDNGKLFDQAAEGYYAERLKYRCGSKKGEEFVRCAKRIVVLREPGRERFFSFLQVVRPGSVDSFTYVGHGLKDQIVFGSRTLVRSVAPSFSMTRAEWTQAEDGALYSDDLAEGSRFTKVLRRAFRPDSDVRFYACDTGQQFAGNFAHAAGTLSAKGSTTGMSFRVQRRDGSIERRNGKIIRDLKPGERYVLESDEPKAFVKVRAEAFKPSLIQLIAEKKTRSGRFHVLTGARAELSPSEIGWSVIKRLGAGSAVGAEFPDAEVVQFSWEERRQIQAASANVAPNRVLERLSRSNPNLSKKLEQVIVATQEALKRAEELRLSDQAVRREGVSLLDANTPEHKLVAPDSLSDQ